MRLLEPYLASSKPTLRGPDQHREFDMFCPLHHDTKRSATLDIDKGLWYCAAGCGGGRIVQLIRRQDEWVEPPSNGGGKARVSNNGNGNGSHETVTEAMVRGWMDALISSPGRLEELMAARGLEVETLQAYEIGWDRDRQAYTIPVRSETGEFWNLRRYQLNPTDDRRKIWSINGMGSPRLFPMSVLEDENPDEIIVCEGEWDSLLTLQHGFHAITRTASATTWLAEWGEKFQGKTVYLCHDADTAGQDANRKVGRALARVADVRIVSLPYDVESKHGKDLTDYWLEGHTAEDFQKLLDNAEPFNQDPNKNVEELDPADASVLDTFDSHRVGQPLRVTVTIKGKRDPGYSVPKKFKLQCTRDAGQKCNFCPLNAAGGNDELDVEPHNPLVLELMDSTKGQVYDAARRTYGAPKCSKLQIDTDEHQAVEVLFARPSVDHTSGHADDYKNLKITSVGRHDTMPNNTVRAVGALHPDPRSQSNEFLAWEVKPVKTTIDSYHVTAKDAKRLRKFRPRKGQRPLQRLGQIARDMEAHVTRIYGRPELHAAMDLVFHSVLAFDFSGQRIERGWLDALFVGDTRTGKSEAASKLVGHYKAGEVITCESASFAGIVGGLQQYGGKEWAINWGAIPINDRRLVVLDEVSGLSPDQIAAMSDVRSRGVAQLTKIQQEATHARTRLIWIGNPRDASMSEFLHGVQAIKPLIGNPEDIARFDFAMAATAHDVSADEINKAHEPGEQQFTSELCSKLVRWAWSRTAEQVLWAPGAEAAVFKAAQELGKRYVEDPPLVQVANARVKVARMAVALAARLFSTDDTYECVVVRREHVEDVVKFLDMIYGMPGFGYYELSNERIKDAQEARAKKDDILRWLRGRQSLAKFLRSNSSFRRQDIEEVMNVSKEEANGIINTLWEARMVTKSRGDVRVEAALHELLRSMNN